MYKRGQCFYSDFFHEGTRYRKSWGQVSRSVAREKEAFWKREIRNGTYAQRLRRVTFETLAEKYLKDYAAVNKKASTFLRNQNSNKALQPHFGGRMIGAITADLAEQYKRTRLEGGAKPATVNRDIDFLRSTIKKAVEWGYLAYNPLSTVKHLKEDNEKMWVLTEPEEDKLLAECDKCRQPRRYLRELVELALNTGMRLGELQGLKKADVHLRERYITVTGTKTNENRNVPLNNRALEIAGKLLAETPSDYLFCNQYGKKLTVLTNSFWHAVDKAGLSVREESSGGKMKLVRRFRFHDLRHTFGSRLGMGGIETKTIMEIMGHRTYKMAMRYQHPTPGHKLAAVSILNKTPPKVTTGNFSAPENLVNT